MSSNLNLHLLYTGYKKVESWWNFKNVISPFYRLYYVSGGEGKVYINDVLYNLSSGQLFLIPKFAFHRYECADFMEHYYICFFDDLMGEIGLSDHCNMNLQLQASPTDILLIKRYLDLNPYKELPASDPLRYDNNKNLYDHSLELKRSQYQQTLESDGILLYLFSHFITQECMVEKRFSNSHEKLKDVIQYINKNLDKHISIQEMANMIYLSADHFSKIFKKIMGLSPSEYLQKKRIYRSQTLLLTTELSISEISESVGFINQSQFSRLFFKITNCSPREFRKTHNLHSN